MERIKLAEIRKTFLERAKRKEEEEAKRKKDALFKAKEVAAFLKSNYNVSNVILFGSLVWGKHFSAYSDIDLLVEGFPEDKNFWRALAESERIAAPFPISLVLADDAVNSLVEKARKEGKTL
jgi:predicted nucleotidyltransferase